MTAFWPIVWPNEREPSERNEDWSEAEGIGSTGEKKMVRPGRLELPHPASEAGTLSTELRARSNREAVRSLYYADGSGASAPAISDLPIA